MASSLTLCGFVPLDTRYEHTLDFPDKTTQNAYFSSLAKYGPFNDYTYLRKESVIRVNIGAEALENAGVNYLFTRNDNKTRYYFITNKVYKADDITELHIDLDVMQTYQFDWTIPPCFVERQHVSDDVPGRYMMDEALELGEYVNNSVENFDVGALAIVVQSSVTLQNPIGDPVRGGIIDNVYSGLALYTRTLNETGSLVLDGVISSLETQGKADGIASMWVYPKEMISADWGNEDDETMLLVKGISHKGHQAHNQRTLDGYTPKNKKLLTYPYNFLYVHNNMGECAHYHYERFGTVFPDGPYFRVYGNIGADGTVRMAPMDYNGVAVNNEEGISLTGYPTCAWTQDAYKIWLAQNANSQALSIQSGNIAVAVGAAQVAFGGVQAAIPLGDGGGEMISHGIQQAYSGYQQVAGVLAARKDAQVQPPQAKGAQSSSCNITMGTQTFQFLYKSIRAENAQAIDSYFSMYGYKINRVTEPQYKNRSNWNYIRTIGCIVKGNIDANDRYRIASIFDKGVTFWHVPSKMYQYTETNGVD